MDGEIFTVSEVARWARVSESYLNKARMTGHGPRFIKVGRAIRYRRCDLEAWLAAAQSETQASAHEPA